MPNLEDILQADVDFIIDHLPKPSGLDFKVIWEGVEYPAAKNTIRRDKLLGIEGLHDRYRFSIYLAQQRLHVIPRVDDLITVDGEEYVILAKETDDIEQLLRLDIGEEFTEAPPLR